MRHVATADVNMGIKEPSVLTIANDAGSIFLKYSALSSPAEFAKSCVGICKLFDAKLVWEKSGPGHVFGHAVQKEGYENI